MTFICYELSLARLTVVYKTLLRQTTIIGKERQSKYIMIQMISFIRD